MPTNGKIAGVVREGITPVAAGVTHLYDRATGVKIASQTTDANGLFVFSGLDETLAAGYFVVALDPDGGTQYNAMIYDRLTAVTSLTRPVVSNGFENSLFGVSTAGFGSLSGYIRGLTPLAYWRLNEAVSGTIIDEMGLANMTVTGTFQYGQPSGTFDTDGTSIAHSAVGTTERLGTGKITGLVPGNDGYSIIGLMKLPIGSQYQSMFAWRNYTSGGADYIFAVCGRDHADFNGEVGFQTWSYTTVATTVNVNGTKDDRWHLYGLVYDKASNTMKLYVDGFLLDSRVQGTPTGWPTSASVTLFNNVDGALAQSSNCSIDEFAVFDRPLTATQMMAAAAAWVSKVRLNQYDKAAGVTLSGDSMTATSSAGSWESVRATHRKTTGRWYWETVVTANPNNLGVLVGVAPHTMATDQYPGQISNSGGIWAKGAAASQYYAGGNVVRSGLAAIPVGAVIGHVYDAELGTHDVYLNGTPLASYYGFTPPHYPMIAVYGGGSATARFSEFTQAVPPGCTEYIKAERTISDIAGWNPADKGSVWTLSMLRPKAISNAASPGMMRASVSKSSGTRYFEVKVEANITTSTAFGVCTAAADINSFVGKTAYGWAYEPGGYKRNNDAYSAYGAAYTTGDVIGVLVDFGAQTLTFYKNGVSQGVAYTNVSGTLFPAASTYNTAATIVSLNMGYTAFVYALPSGAVAWDS